MSMPQPDSSHIPAMPGEASELTLKPNYPGLLVTALFMCALGYICFQLIVFLHSAAPPDSLETETSLVQLILTPFLAITLVACLASLLDILRTALTGLRREWQVRITQDGIHHPFISPRFIPWQNVEAISVARGYNGRDIWFTLDPSVQPSPLFSGFVSLLARRRVSHLRLLAHKFRIDAAVFLRALNEIVPERLGIEYRLD